jgi:hypothetical protein
MAGIFINYRREDAPGVAGRLFDYLATKFSHDDLFMDVDAMKPSMDFLPAFWRQRRHAGELPGGVPRRQPMRGMELCAAGRRQLRCAVLPEEQADLSGRQPLLHCRFRAAASPMKPTVPALGRKSGASYAA